LASTALADDLADALAKQQRWRDKASEGLEARPDVPVRMRWPRIGPPLAAAILPAIGDVREDTTGQPLGNLAGLDLRLFDRASSSRPLPKIAPLGRADRRDWRSPYALRLIAPAPQCPASSQPATPVARAGVRGRTTGPHRGL
jgi:hypothetical protein